MVVFLSIYQFLNYFIYIFSISRCDYTGLEDALLKRVMVTPEEVIKRSLDPDNALVSRDGLAKTLYSRLFDWYDATFDFSSYLSLFPTLVAFDARFENLQVGGQNK